MFFALSIGLIEMFEREMLKNIMNLTNDSPLNMYWPLLWKNEIFEVKLIHAW